MRINSICLLISLIWSVSCQSSIGTKEDRYLKENDPKLDTSFALQYEKDIPSKVLKVGPNLEISIGQFALESFDRLGSQLFRVHSYEERNSNTPLEPGSIILKQVQVNRTLVFEEGTTKFQYATFVSIVELLFVKNTGETYRILGHSEPLRTNTVPFSPNDSESEDTIATSIRFAMEMGLKKIIASKDEGEVKKREQMFNLGNGK